MSQPHPYHQPPPHHPHAYYPPRAKFVVPAWLGFAFGIAGVVGIPLPILNNATALLAVAGLVCAIVALWGSRKVIAIIGLVLCLAGFAGTVAIQSHWSRQLDQIEQDLNR